MKRSSLAAVSLAWMLAGLLPGGASAEDAPAGARAPSAPMELRVYPVRALLRGHLVRQIDRGPFPVAPDMVNDETRPLFGREMDDPVFALGEPNSVLESIKAEVGGAGAWEQEGVSLAYQGANLLAVRAPHELQAQVATWLSDATRAVLRTVVLDVAAFRGDPAEARAEGGVTGALARGAWVPLGAVRMTLLSTGAAVGRAGALRAFLQDLDVEVAEDSNTVDPIVGVLPEGLAVEAHCVPTGGGRVQIRLKGWWASPAVWAPQSTGEGDRFEKPTVEGTSFETTLESGDGTWAPLPGSGRLAFAARARIEDPPTAAQAVEGVLLSPAVASAPEGPLVLQSYDVRDLGLPIAPGRGAWVEPWPSNFTPPEPPHLPDATPPVTMDSLVELLKTGAWPGTWEREGASLQTVQGMCRARTDAARQAEVASALDRLRATLLRTTRLRATIVAMPWASCPEWWAGVPADFAKDGGASLLARPGARVVESSGLRLREGERRAAVSGAHRSYVADYDVEIAKASAIGNPIVRSLFDGSSLDVENDRALGAPVARLALRLDVAHLVEMRDLTTRHGDIECPAVDLARAHGEVAVPVGTTRVVAVWGSGGEVRLVLLTVNGE